jgi:hypothetical protein
MNITVREYDTAYNVLRESEIGKERGLFMDDPFFYCPFAQRTIVLFSDADSPIDLTMMLGSLREEDHQFLRKVNMPSVLTYAYKVLGSCKREFKYKGFTFFSLEGIKRSCEMYEGDGQYNFCDIGMQYYGMGHIKALTLCRETGLLFIRIDGGSSGCERELNYNKFIKLDKMEENVFSMEEFIKKGEELGENLVYLG